MQLVNSYIRRKRWEFRGIAVAIVNTLNESMSGNGSGTNGNSNQYINGHRVISTDAMFDRIGLG